MAQVIIFDPSSTPVANRVKQFLTSVNTPEYEGKTGVLINPVLPDGFLVDNAKVLNGSVVLLTQADLDAIASQKASDDAANSAFNLAIRKAYLKEIYTTSEDLQNKAFRAALETVIELTVTQINALRTKTGMPTITDAQVKTAFASAYQTKIDAF